MKTKIYEKLKGYGSYDFLIVNSVEPSRILDRVSKFDVPVLAVMHNPTLLIQNENYRKFFDNPERNIIVLAMHVSKYLKDNGISSDWVFPSYFGDISFSNHSEKIVFCVQGVVEFSRRNYQALLESVKKIIKKGYDNFIVKIVGGIVSPDLNKLKKIISENKLQNYFDIIEGDLPYDTYLKQIGESDYLLPLIDEESTNYYSSFTKISTSVPISIGMGVVPIIIDELARLYNIENCSLMYSNGDLTSSLEKAIDLKQNKQIKLNTLVKKKGCEFLNISSANLENSINKITAN